MLTIIQVQTITFIIVILFLVQKNGHLKRKESSSLLTWLAVLSAANALIICLSIIEVSAFNLLMLASVNGLVTILYLYIQNYELSKN
ncbi:hypothetical protein [Vagococcus hydrophili]|uniref:Holin n=1 Tax=Vagococcus hydrophili TaxID=2714947 RepID=A0A6G8AVJ8_9ENTE|nr:hypothetical protein [Vagococcus hydrophili]QIL49017.1 hypothetical protein G7082_11105 [Vagococcus hydrophili]